METQVPQNCTTPGSVVMSIMCFHVAFLSDFKFVLIKHVVKSHPVIAAVINSGQTVRVIWNKDQRSPLCHQTTPSRTVCTVNSPVTGSALQYKAYKQVF